MTSEEITEYISRGIRAPEVSVPRALWEIALQLAKTNELRKLDSKAWDVDNA